MDFFKGDNKDSPVSAAMDFFKGDKKDTPAAASGTGGGELQKKSSTELLASAKLVAEAAQSALHNQPDNLDKQKVAGAAADLLDAAKGYGNLGQDGVGKYVDQAEDYLHKYSTSGKTSAATPPPPDAADAAPAPAPAPASAPPPDAADAAPVAVAPAAPEEEKSGSDYLKMAQGFLGKH